MVVTVDVSDCVRFPEDKEKLEFILNIHCRLDHCSYADVVDVFLPDVRLVVDHR
jgi:hypothetical protein